MSLKWIRDVGEFGKIGIWHIRENYDQLMNLISLSDSDQITVNGMNNEMRKKQWMAARILVKELVGQQYEVVYDKRGKPSLEGSKMHISFSHSGDMVASIAHSKHDVGVDIQEKKKKIQKIQHKFLSKEELKYAKDDIDKLHVYWCAKEALFKYYNKGGVDFCQHLYIHDFGEGQEGMLKGEIRKDDCNHILDLRYEQLGNYTLVHVEEIVVV